MDDILAEKISNKLLTAFNDILIEEEKDKTLEPPVSTDTYKKVYKTFYVLTDRPQKNACIRIIPLPSSQFITDEIGKFIPWSELASELYYLNGVKTGYSIVGQLKSGQRISIDNELDYITALETAFSRHQYLDLCLYFVVPPLDPNWMDELPAEIRLLALFPQSILTSIEKKFNETKKEVERSLINKIVTSINKTLANFDKEQKREIEFSSNRKSLQRLDAYTCANCQNSTLSQYANGREFSKSEQARFTKVEEDKNFEEPMASSCIIDVLSKNLVKKNSEEIENSSQMIEERRGKNKAHICLDASFLSGISSKLTFEAGSKFTKIWNVRNVGSTSWDSSTLLKFVSGDPLLETEGKIQEFSVPHLKPNESGVISITFIVPNVCGNYNSCWRLYHKGRPFGRMLFCDVKVVDVKNSVDELACHIKLDEENSKTSKPTLQAALQALHDSNNFIKKDVKSHTVTPNSTPFTFSPPKSPEPNEKNEKCDETSDEDSGSSIVQLDRVNSDSSLSESMDFVFVSKCFGLSSPLSSQIIEPLEVWKDSEGNNEVTTQPKSHITSKANATEKFPAEASTETQSNNCESLVEIADKPDINCGFEILVPPILSTADSLAQKTSCDSKAESFNTEEKLNNENKNEMNAIGNADVPVTESPPDSARNQNDHKNTGKNSEFRIERSKVSKKSEPKKQIKVHETIGPKTDYPSVSNRKGSIYNCISPITMINEAPKLTRSNSTEFKIEKDASSSNEKSGDSKNSQTYDWNKPSGQDQDQNKDFQNVDFNTPVINLVDAVKSVSQHAISICRGVGLLALKPETTISSAVGVLREVSKNQKNQKMDNTSTNFTAESNKVNQMGENSGSKLKLVDNSRSETITVMDESMIQLFEMGFTDYGLNEKLLLKNDYIMSDTIDELLRIKNVVSTQPRQNQRKYDFLKELD